MSDAEHVQVTPEHDGVVEIVFDRPGSLNALDDRMLREIPGVVRGVAADGAVRAIVISGAGKVFCAGGDLFDLGPRLSGAGVEGARQHMLAYHQVVRAIQEVPVPVVAAVSGACAGAGISIASACDVVVVERSTKFTPGFTKAGLIPDLGALYFWLEAMGPRRAKEFAMLGEPLDAEAALAHGLANRVVEDGRARAEALAVAGQLAAGPPSALAMVKAVVNAVTAADRDRTLQIEAFAQAAAFNTGEVDEGVAAFRDRRTPVFAPRQG